jgi:hypothetical protein
VPTPTPTSEFTKIVASETEEKIDESLDLDLVYREPTESGGDGVRRIVDEFTDLEVSRQRKWQLRRAKEGKCIKCGAAAAPGSGLCVRHHVKTALYHHQRNSPGKKPLNSKWLKLATSTSSGSRMSHSKTAPHGKLKRENAEKLKFGS